MASSAEWKKQSLSRRIDIFVETSGLSAEKMREGHHLTSFQHFLSLARYNQVRSPVNNGRYSTKKREHGILRRLHCWIEFSKNENNQGRQEISGSTNSKEQQSSKGMEVKTERNILSHGLANLHFGRPRFRSKSSSTPNTLTLSRSSSKQSNRENDMTNHVLENYTTSASYSSDHNVLDMIGSAESRSHKPKIMKKLGGAAERKLRQRNQKSGKQQIDSSDSISVTSGVSLESSDAREISAVIDTANKYGTLPRVKFKLGFLKAAFDDKRTNGGQSSQKESDKRRRSQGDALPSKKRFLFKRNKKEKKDEVFYPELLSNQHTSTPSYIQAGQKAVVPPAVKETATLYWTERDIKVDGKDSPLNLPRNENLNYNSHIEKMYKASGRNKLFTMPPLNNYRRERREMDNI